MKELALAIACSVSVSVLLKLAPRLQIDIRQAIAVNYWVAAALVLALLQPAPQVLRQAPWSVWLLLVVLGVALPAMFWVLAAAVRQAGVVRTDAAMRLSLVLPLLAAFALFGQPLTANRGLGVVLGLAAMALLVVRRDGATPGRRGLAGLLLLVVFAGMGGIDIVFKLMARWSPASSATVLLAAFTLAAVLSLAALAWLYRRRQARWRWRHLGAGLLLGVLNCANIVFYIGAHRALPGDPALVFAAMNIGVIVLATLVGVVAFRERLHLANVAGLLLAVAAVWILAGA